MLAQRLPLSLFLSILLIGCKEERHFSAFIYENESAASIACLDQENAEFSMEWVYPHSPQQRQLEILEHLEQANARCSTIVRLIDNLAQSRSDLQEGFSMPNQNTFWMFQSPKATMHSLAFLNQ